MDILTHTSQVYITAFKGFMELFFSIGEWLFFSLLLIQIVWLCIGYAFDTQNFTEGMSAFLKKLFIATFFYTLMLHPEWLFSLLKSAQVLGGRLTGMPTDPSSLITQGITLGNKILNPVKEQSLLMAGFGLILLSAVYIVIEVVFISIALELAVTLIMTAALIAMSPFLLAFSALNATQSIARQNLDIIIANCVKLLGIYLVVAAGTNTITEISNAIPSTPTALQEAGFDPYMWVSAAVLLFWLLAKNLPNQLAKMVTIAVQDLQGTSSAAIAMTALQTAKMAASPVLKAAAIANKPLQTINSIASELGGKAYDRLFTKENGEGNATTSSNPSAHSNGSLSAQLKSMSELKAKSSQSAPQGKNT